MPTPIAQLMYKWGKKSMEINSILRYPDPEGKANAEIILCMDAGCNSTAFGKYDSFSDVHTQTLHLPVGLNSLFSRLRVSFNRFLIDIYVTWGSFEGLICRCFG